MAPKDHLGGVLVEHHRMEGLPSMGNAPILEKYQSLGLDDFKDRYALETPLCKNGTVNHHQLVRAVKNLVRADYQWEAPFFDEHHLYWPASDYELPTLAYGGQTETILYEKGGNGLRYFEASVIEDEGQEPRRVTLSEEQVTVDRLFSELIDLSEFEVYGDDATAYFAVADQFRELPMNKLWVPRQFHNFIHAVTLPPEMPELRVMQRIVRNARRRDYLFQVATNAMTINEKLQRSELLALPGGETVLIDRKDRRIYQNPSDLEARREEFVRELIQYHQEKLIDLTRLAPMEVVDGRSVERSLSVIALRLANSELIITRHNNRAWRVELPTKHRTHSVWLKESGSAVA